MNLQRRFFASIIFLMIAIVSAQEVRVDLNLKVGKELRIFTNSVQLVDEKSDKAVVLKDGSYIKKSGNNNFNITVKNKLISGDATILSESDGNTYYKIKNSFIQSFKVYDEKEKLIMDAYRDAGKAYFKEYSDNGELKSDGYTSLDKKKNFGNTVSKIYFSDGKVAKINDQISGIYTEYYENGNVKSKVGRVIYEYYREDGTLENKQFTKNGVLYNDFYYEGKLSTHSYKNKEGQDVKIYYNDGVFEKTGIEKIKNGNRREFFYDKAGKLLGDEQVGVSEVQGIKEEPTTTTGILNN